MKGHQIIFAICLFFFLACACISCESSSSNSDPGAVLPPTGDMELVGTWAGYFLSGVDDVVVSDPDGDDEMDFDNDDIFVIGIITREREARFIGDVSQFVCPEGDLDVRDVLNVRKLFGSGNLSYYTWDTTGIDTGTDEPYGANVESMEFMGNTFFSIYLLTGLYWYKDTPEADRDYWQFQLFNYSTSGISADVGKLAGEWEIGNAYREGNILTFTVTEEGSINGEDDDGNTLSGSIIEIHYGDTFPGTEIYDLSLTLNTGGDPISLEGLATYISTMDSEGIDVERSLIIGATDESHMITGLATPVVVP